MVLNQLDGKLRSKARMKINTKRQRAVVEALRALIPHAPLADFEPIALSIRASHMADLSPVDAAFLATVAHIRHRYTDYDELRDEGYEKDAARYFVLDQINEVLSDWGATRLIDDEQTIEWPST